MYCYYCPPGTRKLQLHELDNMKILRLCCHEDQVFCECCLFDPMIIQRCILENRRLKCFSCQRPIDNNTLLKKRIDYRVKMNEYQCSPSNSQHDSHNNSRYQTDIYSRTTTFNNYNTNTSTRPHMNTYSYAFSSPSQNYSVYGAKTATMRMTSSGYSNVRVSPPPVHTQINRNSPMVTAQYQSPDESSNYSNMEVQQIVPPPLPPPSLGAPPNPFYDDPGFREASFHQQQNEQSNNGMMSSSHRKVIPTMVSKLPSAYNSPQTPVLIRGSQSNTVGFYSDKRDDRYTPVQDFNHFASQQSCNSAQNMPQPDPIQIYSQPTENNQDSRTSQPRAGQVRMFEQSQHTVPDSSQHSTISQYQPQSEQQNQPASEQSTNSGVSSFTNTQCTE